MMRCKRLMEGYTDCTHCMAVEYSISITLGRQQDSEYLFLRVLYSKILERYFGSASGELGTLFIVITTRTKFPDSKEMRFIQIYISRVNSETDTRARKRLVASISMFSS